MSEDYQGWCECHGGWNEDVENCPECEKEHLEDLAQKNEINQLRQALRDAREALKSIHLTARVLAEQVRREHQMRHRNVLAEISWQEALPSIVEAGETLAKIDEVLGHE